MLCDNPSNQVPRQTINLKHVNLTDIVIKVPHGARTRVVRKVYDKAEVDAKWEKTAWAQKLAKREKRKTLNDFDRFKLKLARQKVFIELYLDVLSFSSIIQSTSTYSNAPFLYKSTEKKSIFCETIHTAQKMHKGRFLKTSFIVEIDRNRDILRHNGSV